MPFELIEKIYKEKDRKREELRKSTLSRLSSVLESLAGVVRFDKAYMFGSIVKPHSFNVDSDLDVAFEGLEKEKFFQVVAYLSREMERDVDVVELERCRFREKIEKEGLLWTSGS